MQEEHSDITKDELFENLSQILFFPSWSGLIQSESFLGSYLNQPVHKMFKDNVILLPDLVLTGQEKSTGDPYIFLAGVGMYYVQFGLSPGEIITDYREITGLMLPLETYDKAQDISGSMINSEKLTMTEYMISIPFSLILTKQTTQMYLRGVIARNVLHPYKDCFNQFLSVCRKSNSLTEEDGLKILSGGLTTQIPLYTNELLTEKKIENYSKLTAGLKAIKPSLGKVLADLQLDEEIKSAIFEKIRLIKIDFAEKGYPRLLDWIP